MQFAIIVQFELIYKLVKLRVLGYAIIKERRERRNLNGVEKLLAHTWARLHSRNRRQVNKTSFLGYISQVEYYD